MGQDIRCSAPGCNRKIKNLQNAHEIGGKYFGATCFKKISNGESTQRASSEDEFEEETNNVIPKPTFAPLENDPKAFTEGGHWFYNEVYEGNLADDDRDFYYSSEEIEEIKREASSISSRIGIENPMKDKKHTLENTNRIFYALCKEKGISINDYEPMDTVSLGNIPIHPALLKKVKEDGLLRFNTVHDAISSHGTIYKLDELGVKKALLTFTKFFYHQNLCRELIDFYHRKIGIRLLGIQDLTNRSGNDPNQIDTCNLIISSDASPFPERMLELSVSKSGSWIVFPLTLENGKIKRGVASSWFLTPTSQNRHVPFKNELIEIIAPYFTMKNPMEAPFFRDKFIRLYELTRDNPKRAKDFSPFPWEWEKNPKFNRGASAGFLPETSIDTGEMKRVIEEAFKKMDEEYGED